MGTVLASKVIANARRLLADVRGRARSDDVLLEWLNEGQRMFAEKKPSISVVTVDFDMEAGHRQTLPEEAVRLAGVKGNGTAGEPGPVVYFTEREYLDNEDPSWRSHDEEDIVLHYAYDPGVEPKIFDVYPPNDGTGSLRLTYSVIPEDVTDVADPITLDDEYADALTDYIAFRAFSEDSDNERNAARAEKHEERAFRQFA